jgi:hypothetical protein
MQVTDVSHGNIAFIFRLGGSVYFLCIFGSIRRIYSQRQYDAPKCLLTCSWLHHHLPGVSTFKTQKHSASWLCQLSGKLMPKKVSETGSPSVFRKEKGDISVTSVTGSALTNPTKEVSLSPSPEVGKRCRSQTSCFLVSFNSQRWKKSRNPVILIVIQSQEPFRFYRYP